MTKRTRKKKTVAAGKNAPDARGKKAAPAHKTIIGADGLFKVLVYPDPFLDRPAREVTDEEFAAGKADGFDLRELLERMTKTMYLKDGVGLAGPQIGLGLRLFVADPEGDLKNGRPTAVFNPELTTPPDAKNEVKEEGCLSLPGVRGNVKRPRRVRVRGRDVDGKPLEFEAEDLFCRICRHEADHLDGILFIRRMNSAARLFLRRQLAELEGLYALKQMRRSSSVGTGWKSGRAGAAGRKDGARKR